MNQLVRGQMLFEKGNQSWVDTREFKHAISQAWGVSTELIVFYSDHLFIIPGTPYVEWRLFDAASRVYVDWLICDLKTRGGHNDKISEVLGFVRSVVEPGSVVHDDDVIPLC